MSESMRNDIVLAKRWGLDFGGWNAEFFGTGRRSEEAIRNLKTLWEDTSPNSDLSFQYTAMDGNGVDNNKVLAMVHREVHGEPLVAKLGTKMKHVLPVALHFWRWGHWITIQMVRTIHTIWCTIGIQLFMMRQIVCPVVDATGKALGMVWGTQCWTEPPPLPKACPLPQIGNWAAFASRWFTASRSHSDPRAASSEDTVVLFIHGGAFQLHIPVEHFCAYYLLPRLHRVPAMFAPGYSLQPEVSHARQVCECLLSFQYLVDSGIEHIIISGDSAGGNLALSLVVELMKPEHSALREKLAGVLLVSPWLDVHRYRRAYAPWLNTSDFLSTSFLRSAAKAYDGPDLAAFLASVAAAGEDFPPTCCISGGGEILRGDAAALSMANPQRIRAIVVEGEPHDFPFSAILCRNPLSSPKQAWGEAAAFLNRALRARVSHAPVPLAWG